MKGWFLLYCKPKSEQRAQLNLGLQGLETYLPMVQVEKKEKGLSQIKRIPLFPNYLFVKFDPKEFSVSKIHSTRGVSRLVDCSEQLIPLNDVLITRLKYHEVIAPVLSAKTLCAGEKVRVLSGPFSELEGVFVEKNGEQRCKVLFKFLGQMRTLDFSMEDVESLSV